MFPSAVNILFLGSTPGETGWFGPVAAAMGGSAICLLVWQLWRAQRHYALELAELVRQVAEEQEKARLAGEEKDAVVRESQSKSEMLATLSREIRAHLNGIIGSADLMLDSPLTAPQRAHLTTLRSSAEALHQSLNDVLDFSSIETGQIKIGRARFDLRQPLIEVVEQLSPLAALKGLELVLIVAPDVPVLVSGDPARLRQILLNLASNAVKFAHGGRVVLRVELPAGSGAASKDGGTWLQFSVTESGAAVAGETQPTIFDRFAESDSPEGRRFGGSGLGLAICKRLVELMGGQIGARSTPESGSEFWMMLALPADQAQPVPAAPAGGRHVVVLDEVTASRVAVSAMLARLSVDQDATDTLAKAAGLLHDAIESGARDLVLLLDDSIARSSAGEIAHLFALDPALRSTRIVLMSREPEPEAMTTAGHAFAVTAVVRKPLLRAEFLLEALNRTPGLETSRTPFSRIPFDAGGESRPPIRPGAHVLVVDDDEISRSVTSQLLGRLGCTVERAVSGAEAIAQAHHTRFDLIFMDCQMPEMDGFTTTERIRAAAGSKAPPVVALTANTSAKDRERCFAAGMCDFVDKPVRKTELARVLRRWTQPETVTAE
jgi:signal transduction histidine kinase/ActR/RegA family two-component response regulator